MCDYRAKKVIKPSKQKRKQRYAMGEKELIARGIVARLFSGQSPSPLRSPLSSVKPRNLLEQFQVIQINPRLRLSPPRRLLLHKSPLHLRRSPRRIAVKPRSSPKRRVRSPVKRPRWR